jgi:hypothetical protein
MKISFRSFDALQKGAFAPGVRVSEISAASLVAPGREPAARRAAAAAERAVVRSAMIATRGRPLRGRPATRVAPELVDRSALRWLGVASCSVLSALRVPQLVSSLSRSAVRSWQPRSRTAPVCTSIESARKLDSALCTSLTPACKLPVGLCTANRLARKLPVALCTSISQLGS